MTTSELGALSKQRALEKLHLAMLGWRYDTFGQPTINNVSKASGVTKKTVTKYWDFCQSKITSKN